MEVRKEVHGGEKESLRCPVVTVTSKYQGGKLENPHFPLQTALARQSSKIEMILIEQEAAVR